MEQSFPLTEGVYYILLSLYQPRHGYGIIQNVSALTGGRLVLGAGTLYGAISSLLEKQWILLYSEALDARKKKEYLITPLGKAAVRLEIARLESLVKDGREIEEAYAHEVL